ncbi:MAG: hypothetical protein LBQ05_02015 [Christensenellaceae bacterium]|jgi:hypothetical protein|nr:hypothetical protein [Christensenellaceae bacterium]
MGKEQWEIDREQETAMYKKLEPLYDRLSKTNDPEEIQTLNRRINAIKASESPYSYERDGATLLQYLNDVNVTGNATGNATGNSWSFNEAVKIAKSNGLSIPDVLSNLRDGLNLEAALTSNPKAVGADMDMPLARSVIKLDPSETDNEWDTINNRITVRQPEQQIRDIGIYQQIQQDKKIKYPNPNTEEIDFKVACFLLFNLCVRINLEYFNLGVNFHFIRNR